jgi:hypothetical protein
LKITGIAKYLEKNRQLFGGFSWRPFVSSKAIY